MPRLPPINRDDAVSDARPFYDADIARYGTVLNNTEVYAHNVAVLRAIKQFAAASAGFDLLPTAEKALVRVHVARLSGCPF